MINTILLFGPPGSGKGTQASLIQEHLFNKYGLLYKKTSSGNLIKQAKLQNQIQTDQINNTIKDEELFNIFDNYLNFIKFEAENFSKSYDGLILDGIPKLQTQVKPLLERIKPAYILELIISPNNYDELHKRLQIRNREYDGDEKLRLKRINEYYDKTREAMYLVSQLKSSYIHMFDCSNSKEEINNQIQKTLSFSKLKNQY